MRALGLTLMVLVMGALPYAQGASSASADHVHVRLVSQKLPDGVGTPFLIGVHFRIDPEWHIYWRNPGDSGASPKFQWRSDSVRFGTPLWPLPKRFFLGDMVNFGYEEDVVILFEAVRDSVASTDAGIEIEADLEWLVCKIECIPGFAKLRLALSPEVAAADEALISRFAAQLPVEAGAAPRVTVRESGPEGLRVRVDGDGVELFPVDPEIFAPQPPKTMEDGDHQIPWAANRVGSARESSVLIAWLSPTGPRSAVVEIPLTPERGVSFEDLLLVIFAFMGGLILNLMPCVFPVLSIKVLSMVDSAGGRPEAVRRTGWAYTMGVLATFVALGALLLVLRAGGEQIGWGFQLQSPAIVTAMAFLFFILALNFLGVFEMGESIMNRAGGVKTGNHGFKSSFMTGVLSVFVAAPCTGPFMGGALGAAVILPAWAGLLIFASLGAGMALPFLLLAYFPSWTLRLPRPGPWMKTLREFFAFPLLATVVWLLWVLGLQTSSDVVISVLAAFLAAGLFLWWRNLVRGHSLRWILLALVGASVVWGLRESLRFDPSVKSVTESSVWSGFDQKAIDAALAAGRPVFIDFTAAWCVTCQWNKKAVLDTKEAQDLFSRNDVFLVRADWTDRDEEITKALAIHGRASVPLYLYLRSGASPRILPQLLSMSMIEEIFINQQEVSK